MKRKSVRILGVVLAVLLLLVVAVNIFLPVDKIRDLALQQARERLGREVSVGDVSISLRGGLGVRLADFVLANPEGLAGEPLAEVQGVDLKLAIGPLFKGEVRVGRLVLDGPHFNLMTLADGSNNYTFAQAGKPAAPSPDAPGKTKDPAAISVDNFSVRDGSLVFSSAVGPGQETRITGMQGALVMQDPAPGQFAIKGDLKVEQMAFSQLDPPPALPAEMTYELLWDSKTQRLEIQSLQGTVAEFPLTLQGGIQMAAEGPTTQLQGQARDLDLARVWDFLKPMLPPDQKGQLAGRGDLDLELTIPQGGPEQLEYQGTAEVRGASYTDTEPGTALMGLQGSAILKAPSPNQLTITGDLKVEQMTFAQLDPAPALPTVATYEMSWDNTAQRLDIQSLQGTVAEFPVSLRGDVQMAEQGPTTRLKGKAQDIDLDKLWSLVQPLLPPEQKGRLAGRGDLDLDLAVGPGGMDQLTYNGTAVFRKASYTETQLVDELKSMDAELRFDQNQFTVTRSDLKFNSGQFKLTGTLRDPFPYFLPPEMQKNQPVKKPHLDFVLRSPRLDVDRLIPAASPSGAAAGIKNQGKPAAAVLDMEFPDLTASGTFQADSLIYMQVPFTQVTGKMGVRDRKLTCSDVKGAVYDGSVSGQVDIDLNDLNNPGYVGTYQAQKIEVNQFLARFAGLAGMVYGGANMNGSFSARGLDPEVIRNSLTLDSDARLTQGKVITRGQIRGTLGQLAEQSGSSLAGEQTLRDLATHIKVEAGRVGLENLKTRLGDWGDLNFGGYYSFAGNLEYQGNLLLTAEATDRIFASGVMAELAKLLGSQRPARLDLPLTVGGTRSDPKIKLDLAGVTSELQKKAVQEQRGKLEAEAKDKLNDKLNSLLKKWK